MLPAAALVIGRPVKVGTHDSWIEARPLADAAYSPRTVLEYKLDYGAASPIERQNFRLELTVESFRKELARARTFVLKHEAEQLQRQGLGLRVSTADLIVFSENGPLDTTLRYPDECARHKALDMVGDFALSGLDLIGEFEAFRGWASSECRINQGTLCGAQLKFWGIMLRVTLHNTELES